MTHNELILLHEAATAGWHGAKATEGMLWWGGSQPSTQRWQSIADIYSHARLAARAALRAINALEEGTVRRGGNPYNYREAVREESEP